MRLADGFEYGEQRGTIIQSDLKGFTVTAAGLCRGDIPW